MDLQLNEAKVNITYNGQNGDLPDAVDNNATPEMIRAWVTEALRSGTVPNIPADPRADISDFVVDRFAATDARPYNLIQVRPKTPFGA